MDGVPNSGPPMGGPFSNATGPASMLAAPDYDHYLPMLAEFEITEEQGRAMIAVIWSLMRMTVEMQLPFDVCGQLGLADVPVLSNNATPIDSGDQP